MFDESIMAILLMVWLELRTQPVIATLEYVRAFTPEKKNILGRKRTQLMVVIRACAIVSVTCMLCDP